MRPGLPESCCACDPNAGTGRKFGCREIAVLRRNHSARIPNGPKMGRHAPAKRPGRHCGSPARPVSLEPVPPRREPFERAGFGVPAKNLFGGRFNSGLCDKNAAAGHIFPCNLSREIFAPCFQNSCSAPCQKRAVPGPTDDRSGQGTRIFHCRSLDRRPSSA